MEANPTELEDKVVLSKGWRTAQISGLHWWLIYARNSSHFIDKNTIVQLYNIGMLFMISSAVTL